MYKEIKSELYTSPEVDVIEVNARQVICTSQRLGEENDGAWGNV